MLRFTALLPDGWYPAISGASGQGSTFGAEDLAVMAAPIVTDAEAS